MNAETKVETSGLARLREPFLPHHISKLPKPTKAQTEAVKADFKKGVRCKECGSWHHPEVIHLDYVGHAALTDRLLDTDPLWSWEPVAFRDGLPAFDASGGLWIKLTVCGVTRLGYGHAASKNGVDPGAREKEVIGDALRNAAMRFGAALDLWHKGDLHVDETETTDPQEDGRTPATRNGKDAPFPQGPAKNKTELKTIGRTFWREVEGCGDPDELDALIRSHADLTKQIAAALPDWWNGGSKDGEPYDGLSTVILKKQTELSITNPDWRSNPLMAG